MDVSAIAKHIAAKRGISLDAATYALEAWLADPNNTWSTEGDILAAFGITTQGVSTMDEPTQDATIASEMTRETHLALAAYAMAKMLDKLPTNLIDPELQTEYHAHINALDPSKLTF